MERKIYMWPIRDIRSFSKFTSRCQENWSYVKYTTSSLCCYGNNDINQPSVFWKVCSICGKYVTSLVLSRPNSESSTVEMLGTMDWTKSRRATLPQAGSFDSKVFHAGKNEHVMNYKNNLASYAKTLKNVQCFVRVFAPTQCEGKWVLIKQ